MCSIHVCRKHIFWLEPGGGHHFLELFECNLFVVSPTDCLKHFFNLVRGESTMIECEPSHEVLNSKISLIVLVKPVKRKLKGLFSQHLFLVAANNELNVIDAVRIYELVLVKYLIKGVFPLSFAQFAPTCNKFLTKRIGLRVVVCLDLSSREALFLSYRQDHFALKSFARVMRDAEVRTRFYFKLF